jgi:tetratricopeptide (TPR) repeat protein
MVRHIPFIEMLANATPEEWHIGKAGYLVLRTFDDWLRMGPRVVANQKLLNLLQADIEAIPRKFEAHRRATRAILKALLNAEDNDVAHVANELASYGALLRAESRWSLAADVYDSVASAVEFSFASLTFDQEFLAQLRLQQGGAARKAGQYDAAIFAYKRSSQIAKQIAATTIRVQALIGLANVARALGNLSRAERLLTVLLRIMDRRDDIPKSVKGDALHARGSVRQGRTNYVGAIRDLFAAYQLIEDRYTRELVLADLGVCAGDAGYRTTARDALTIIVQRAKNIVAYTVAVVNLLELAVLEGDTEEFEQRCAQWMRVQKKSDPTTNAFAYIYVARGSAKFLSRDDAIRAYETALDYARTMHVHHAEFLLVDEYDQLKREESQRAPTVGEMPIPDDLVDIAGAIADMRKSALAPI